MYSDFHKELKNKDIEISFNGGKLKYSGPAENINEELISKLKKYKQNLIKDYWPKDCFHIMPINTEGNKTPLVLLHIGDFTDAAKSIDKDRPIYGMYHIGSEGETIKYRTVEDFADEYIRQLLKIIPDGPLYLGGMSMGGIIAYEMATRLIKMGREVSMLIIGDAALPNFLGNEKYNWITKGKVFQEKLKWITKIKVIHITYNVIRRVYNYIKYFCSTLKIKLSPSVYYKMNFWERTQYQIFRYEIIAKKYKPKTLFKNKVLLIKAKENELTSQFFGWKNVCKDISLFSFDGDHMAMFYNSKISNLIKIKIQDWIANNEKQKVFSNN